MKILILNSGSSSLKYQVIDMENSNLMVEGICEKIGLEQSFMTYTINGNKEKITRFIPTHKEAVEETLKIIQDKKIGIIKSIDEIDAIGHRVVHGGEEFNQSIIVDKKALDKIEKLSDLAPLHNPANVLGIKICMEIIPNKPNIAVFDTAFHQTMKPEAYLYPIPYEDYTELNIRKYGFHGTSYQFINEEVEKLIGMNKNIIVCHLGNGASVCAIKNGVSVDTSMGLTPLQGLMMGTRCGDIDPSCISYIMKKRNLTIEELDDRLNKKSGMLGIFGESSDSRDIENAVNQGNERAILTEKMYVHRIKSYIGAYSAILGGVDCIVFTAGIGENAIKIRENICTNFEYLGLEFDSKSNSIRTKGIIELSKKKSKIKVYKIPTNEEYMIAKEVARLIL